MPRKLGGYAGKVMEVDLNRGKVKIQPLDQDMARKYIGGVGMAARILWDETSATTDPLSEENPLLFMIGPLNALVPSSSRYTIAAVSPLTGIWGEAHAGGAWGYQLKCAGFDGIIFRGKAKKPVYLWVDDGEARLVDATHLWGKDTYEVCDLLRKETDSGASVAAIGPAGERLVKLAAVITEGREGRAAARCGLGAVMGAKNLKAVVVRGRKKPEVYDEPGLIASIKKYFPRVAPDIIKKGREESFINGARQHAAAEETCFKNFQQVDMKEMRAFGEKIAAQCLEWAKDAPYYCRSCRTSGYECHMHGDKRGPVAYARSGTGSLCLVDSTEAWHEAYEICNRLGVDIISTGGVLAFAMEAFEKGLISTVDTGGVDLSWGNAEAMLQMITKIGKAEGFGLLLGEGVKRAAEQIGGAAPDFALHVKGLEIPQRDPRSTNTRALEFATASRGACQVSGPTFLLARAVSPDLGIYEIQDGPETRFLVKGKGELVAKMQNFGCLLNSLTVCVTLFGVRFTKQVVQPSHFVEWLNYATGYDMSLGEFLQAGERIFNLKRMFNVRRGITARDDTLPSRLLTLKRGGTGASAENLPPLAEMLAEYYPFRGWDNKGKPGAAKLSELGLAED
ncbi:aldehyde ferredoxin oxidoreductase family protein [Chloroflexota bacterium]